MLTGMFAAAGCGTTREYYVDDPLIMKEVHRRIALIDVLRGVESMENLNTLGGTMKLSSIPALMNSMEKDPSPRVRAGCAHALGLAQDSIALDPLERAATKDENQGVRLTAAHSLLLFQDERGIPLLLQGLTAEDPTHRRDAHSALQRFTRRDFGFDPLAEPEVRNAAAKRWVDWYASVPASEARGILLGR
jgi:HEAT repeat protein